MHLSDDIELFKTNLDSEKTYNPIKPFQINYPFVNQAKLGTVFNQAGAEPPREVQAIVLAKSLSKLY